MTERDVERLSEIVANEMRRRAAGDPRTYRVVARLGDRLIPLSSTRFESITAALAEAARKRSLLSDELMIIDAATGEIVDCLAALDSPPAIDAA